MADLIIDDEMLQRLQEIAEQENRPVDDVLRSMMNEYWPDLPELTPKRKSKYPDWLPRSADSPDYDPIDDLIGMFDDNITDLSSMTKEDVMEAYRKKYADTD
ncbi:MAG TPA: hypothetical protein VHD90_19010 [Phototrophicaceae bacterium]|nr:hypothetical protein [Phototrophicaceae bacterium]